jgi:hypothetical protein
MMSIGEHCCTLLIARFIVVLSDIALLLFVLGVSNI